MSGWRIEDIVKQTDGRLLQGNPLQRVVAVSTDSRQLPAESLFVALRGETFDGHDFVEVAMQNGAAAVLVSQDDGRGPSVDENRAEAVAVIQVADTLTALQAMARTQRQRFAGRVVAITGSNGKTTVKEMTAAVLQQRFATFRSPGNLNNHIGLPLSLLQMPLDCDVMVCEMGMNHLGEIQELCSIAQPHIGVVTNIAHAHVGHLGSIENIQRAKGELIDALDAEGIAILNADDARASALGERTPAAVMTFGQTQAALVQGRVRQDLGLDGLECELELAGATWEVRLAIPGRHNLANALAAATVGVALDVSAAEIVSGLEQYRGTYGRMAIRRGRGGVTLIDDTYNANPESMRAALQFLAEVPGAKRRVAVLGDMLELGEAGLALHREIGLFVMQCRVDDLITLGPLAQAVADGAQEAGMTADHIHQASDRQEALTMLQPLLRAGDVVVLKGSRGMAMEHLVEALVAHREGD